MDELSIPSASDSRKEMRQSETFGKTVVFDHETVVCLRGFQDSPWVGEDIALNTSTSINS